MMAKSSEHFSEKELRCKCGCGICNVSPELLNRAEKARRIYDAPMYVNSACRCRNHNIRVGGASDSAHITSDTEQCEAIDIRCTDSRKRFYMIAAFLAAGFTRIELAPTWLHVDVDERKAQDVAFYRKGYQ